MAHKTIVSSKKAAHKYDASPAEYAALIRKALEKPDDIPLFTLQVAWDLLSQYLNKP